MKHLHDRDAVATAELSEFAGRLKHFHDERQARCSSAGSLFFSHFKGLVPPPPTALRKGILSDIHADCGNRPVWSQRVGVVQVQIVLCGELGVLASIG